MPKKHAVLPVRTISVAQAGQSYYGVGWKTSQLMARKGLIPTIKTATGRLRVPIELMEKVYEKQLLKAEREMLERQERAEKEGGGDVGSDG